MAKSELAEQFEEIANGVVEEADSLDCEPRDLAAGLRLVIKILTARLKEVQAEMKAGVEESAVVDDDDELDVDADDEPDVEEGDD
jgi:hypothetical protein